MAEGTVAVPGGSLHYDVVGAGQPIVLMHAGVADSRMWDDQVTPFAQHFRVIRYDIRGFGRSSDPAGDFYHHEDLHAVLDHLSVPDADLVAVSMAGSIAIDFALTYPDRVRRLVLVATGPNGYDRWGDDVRRGWAEENAAIEAGDMERAVEINLRMWVDGPRRTPEQIDPGVRRRVREMLEFNVPREGDGEALDLEPLAIGRLQEIHASTLVIVGDKDVPEIVDSSRLVAREIQGAELQEMAGVAHLPNMERPGDFNTLVINFLTPESG